MTDKDSGKSLEELSKLHRREVLAGMGAAGAAGLAGCSSGDSSGNTTTTTTTTTTESKDTTTTTKEETAFVDAATYTSYMATPPGDSAVTWNPYYYRTQWPRLAYPWAMDRKASRDETTGELIPMAVKNWTISDTKYTLEFAEGGWSDGEPVLGKDFGMPFLIGRWTGRSPEEIKNSDTGPKSVGEAITDVTWDGKKVTVHSEPGWFKKFYMKPHVEGQLVNNGSGSIPTRAETHWREIYDKVKDDPWSEESTKAINSFTEKTRNYKPDDPTSVPTSGPFTLKEIREDGVILEKNEHFRLADKINFPEVELKVMAESRGRNAALKNNILDGKPGLLGTPKANVIDTFPSNIKRHRHTGSSPNSILLNQQANKWLGDPRVRQAILMAVEKSKVAEVVHKYAASAPEHPPGLMRTDHRKWVPQKTRKKYLKYNFDLEEATKRMEAAGLSKENGKWVKPDGQPLSLELISGGDTVQVEQVITAMLKNFGIEVTLRKQSQTVVNNRLDSGDFEMALLSWPTGPLGLYNRALQQSVRRHRFGIWSDEAVNKWVEAHENIVNKQYDWTKNVEGFTLEQSKHWTIQAPPVGEPNGELQDYPVMYYCLLWGRNISEEKRQEVVTKLTWAFNYNLTHLPFARQYQLAFQDHEEWNAPTGDAWRQYEPTYRLMAQGKIQANADAF